MANKLAQEIERILAEELGEFIAQATLKKNLEQMGVSPNDLSAAQLEDLSVRLEKSVNFFGGNSKGAAVAGKVRALKA